MSRFVYVTYIRTTPAKLWQALTEPQFTERYWFGARQECDWKVGSPWKLVMPTVGLADSGEVLEVAPEKRLVLSWRNEFMPELKAEGFSRMTYDLEPDGETVKLTVTHESDGEVFIEKVSGGWPKILSSLKSLLETGEPLPRPA
jgi:uncharacterized protein YndB with AHSA1/START domain